VSWLRSNQRSAWIIGLTLTIPALLYLNALLGLLSMRQGYQSEIDALAPRIARLQGLTEHEDQLRESAIRVDKRVGKLAYPATEDRATVSARLQKNVRQIFVEAGLSVSNSQVLPVREENAFDYIGLKLTVTGDVAALDAAMAAVAGYTPLLLVESLDVWPARGSSRKSNTKVQTINASLQLLSLRAVQ
jgi:general secretion pathway protein M